MKYELKNDKLNVTFQSLGGTLTSIKNTMGKEFLWQGDPHYWGGQSPILFPICGSLRNNQANLLNGKLVQMPRHGIVRKSEFSLIEKTNDTVIFGISSTHESLEIFPFDFELTVKYSLINNIVCTEYTVINNSKENLPYSIGGHPGFNCPIFDNEDFEDYYLEFPNKETCSIPTSIPDNGLINIENRIGILDKQDYLELDREMFNHDAIVFDNLKSRSIKLVSRRHSHGIQLDFNDFPYLVLWSSQNNGPFIAIEPWSGLSTCNDENDVFEMKRGISLLEPNETKKHQFDIRIF